VAGALSGVIVEAWGYPTLTLLAALAATPLILLLVRPVNRLVAGPGETPPTRESAVG
jgi:hypothetical protein